MSDLILDTVAETVDGSEVRLLVSRQPDIIDVPGLGTNKP